MIDKAYGKFANRISDFIGSVWSLVLLFAVIIVTGVYFEFSHRWETLFHLAMTFIALMAVFFLQRSQRQDNRATNLKLDELIKSLDGPRDHFAKIEKESEEVIEDMALE